MQTVSVAVLLYLISLSVSQSVSLSPSLSDLECSKLHTLVEWLHTGTSCIYCAPVARCLGTSGFSPYSYWGNCG